MRASRALAVTAAACGVMVLSAPPAAAGGGPRNDPDDGPRNISVSVRPFAVHQGGILHITVRGCRLGGTVESNAFPRTRLWPARLDDDRGYRLGDPGDDRVNRLDDNKGDRPGNRLDDNKGNRGDPGDDRGNRLGDDRDNRWGEATARARIRDNATPGRYNLVVRCRDNNPRLPLATQRFEVLAGWGAQGGLGGSFGPTSTETAVGAGLLATAAVGGSLFLVRRRRTVGGAV